MQLAIYMLCDEEQLNPHTENPIRTQWIDCEPDKGKLVSFGSDRQFEVATVYSFAPTDNNRVEAVHVAFCQLLGSDIPKEDWQCWKWKEDYPNESVYVQLEEIGMPDLGVGFYYVETTPQIGERITGGILAGGSDTRMVSVPTKWAIDEFETFQPTGEAPYTKVDLVYCKVVSMGETTEVEKVPA